MATKMKASVFVDKLIDVAENYKTLYVMGCFGSPMTAANKSRYTQNHTYNMQASRTKMINAATADTFGFDCVNLIKGILWGWNGNKKSTYGGSKYRTNGVPDVNADGMIKLCSELSTDFKDIEIGEAVWTNGHIGVYIGNGLAVECTPAWKNCVQITACNCKKAGYPTRNWKKHGKLPYITYDMKPATTAKKKSIDEIAKEVIAGKWGTGAARKSALTKAGYDYEDVQERVNELVSGKKSVKTVAKEVLEGNWGNGAVRKNKLIKAGYDYEEVQKEVNKLLA